MLLCDAAAARLLLHYNGDENAVSSTTGETVLHWAAYYGNAAVTDLLLRVGADPEKTRWV
jgi:ankyrin repeat protein